MIQTNYEILACDINGNQIEDFYYTDEKYEYNPKLDTRSVAELINEGEERGLENILPKNRDKSIISLDVYFRNRPYVKKFFK